jgi:hypothetical protein
MSTAPIKTLPFPEKDAQPPLRREDQKLSLKRISIGIIACSVKRDSVAARLAPFQNKLWSL